MEQQTLRIERKILQRFSLTQIGAGDKSTGVGKRHFVSSAMVFANGRLVTAWPRTLKSIALSSCESEYLAGVGGGSEALCIAALRPFGNYSPREKKRERERERERETEARIISDSSSCRAFSQRQGVGRLKHINVKYPWLQEKIKECALQMVSPRCWTSRTWGRSGLQKLSVTFWCFSLVWWSMTGVGENAFNSYLQKKTSLETGWNHYRWCWNPSWMVWRTCLSKSPNPWSRRWLSWHCSLWYLARLDEINYDLMVRHYTIAEIFLERPWLMLSYALVVMVLGIIIIGHYLKMAIHKIELSKVLSWGKEGDWNRRNSPSLMIGIRPTWSWDSTGC